MAKSVNKNTQGSEKEDIEEKGSAPSEVISEVKRVGVRVLHSFIDLQYTDETGMPQNHKLSTTDPIHTIPATPDNLAILQSYVDKSIIQLNF